MPVIQPEPLRKQKSKVTIFAPVLQPTMIKIRFLPLNSGMMIGVMNMKKIILMSLLMKSTFALALPSPQYVPLVNTVELGKYIETSMNEIVRTSSELAKIAVPNSHYFLITTSIEITPAGDEIDEGTKPMATLTLVDFGSQLTCKRDIYAKVQADHFGENRKIKFSLSPGIRCNQN